jgi:hypothetical protein
MKNPLSFPARLLAYPIVIAATVAIVSAFKLGTPATLALIVLAPLSIEMLMGHLGLN